MSERKSKNVYGIILREDGKTKNKVLLDKVSFNEVVSKRDSFLDDLEKNIKPKFPKAKMFVKVTDKKARKVLRYVNLKGYGLTKKKEKTNDKK